MTPTALTSGLPNTRGYDGGACGTPGTQIVYRDNHPTVRFTQGISRRRHRVRVDKQGRALL